MPRIDPNEPIVAICGLCHERMPTTRRAAFYDAVNHGLDYHPAELQRAFDNPRRLFRFTRPAGQTVRLAPSHL